MVREWREEKVEMFGNGYGFEYAMLWIAILVSFCMISAIMFSCAQGVSKPKTTNSADSEHYDYGAACGAGCGGACGA